MTQAPGEPGPAPHGDEKPVERGLYVLGSNHRLITIASQQIRAANLIDKLLLDEEDPLVPDMDIAIVGAGFAGLTAAAYALSHGVHVTLFERRDEYLALQADSSHRWVHPTVYEWPTRSLDENRTNLPVLNWTADFANRVVEQVRGEWNEIRWSQADLLEEHLCSEVVSVRHHNGATEITWRAGGQETNRRFRHAILAVGFGTEEAHTPGASSYWNSSDGVRTAQPGERWLVSGFGDGALADVLRIMIEDFRPEEVVELLQEVPDGELTTLLQSLEQKALAARVGNKADVESQRELDRAYREEVANHPEAEELREYLSSVLVPDVELVIQGRKDSFLYGTTSAVANRFLMSQIEAILGSDEYGGGCSVVQESWTSAPYPSGDGYCVPLPSLDEHKQFNGMVVRHGPRPALSDLVDIFGHKLVQERRENLRAWPQLLDPSRERRTDAPPIRVPAAPRLLKDAPDGTDECLIIQRDDSPLLPKFVELALRSSELREKAAGITGRELLGDPSVADAREAFLNLSRLEEVLQRLCTAAVVVADLSEFDPGVLFLLGVRAVVRRGVTIAAIHPYPKLGEWDQVIPFNLRELRLHAFSEFKTGQRTWADHDADNPAFAIRASILSGLAALHSDTSHQDLPGFAEVRGGRDGWEQRAAGSRETMALFLGPYNEKSDDGFGKLSSAINVAFKDWQPIRCERVIDERHLGLTSRRLYEAMRYSPFCVADWTGWRANVFFEFGVRVAVSPHGALPIATSDWLEEQREKYDHRTTHGQLLRMFGPEGYGQDPEEACERIYNLARRTTEPATWPVRSRAGGVPQSFVYSVVSKAAAVDQDPFLDEVHHALGTEVERKFGGRKTGEASELSELYAPHNNELVRRYVRAQRERLLAAWFYLEQRYGLEALAEGDRGRAREFVDIGERLEALLRNSSEPEALLDRIREATRTINAAHPRQAKT